MASAAIIRELRQCAAYFSLSYIFRKVESKRKDERFALIEEQFYGNNVQPIKEAIYQLIDGDNAFASSMVKLVELKFKMVDRIGNGESNTQFSMLSINNLIEKLERLNGELEALCSEKNKTNPIVGLVLEHAATAIGLLKRGNKKEDDDGEMDDGASFVASIIGTD
jgi:hypothetical protein